MIGVELDEGQKGGCNGTIDGKTYFKCPENQGIFVLRGQIQNVVAGRKRREREEKMSRGDISELKISERIRPRIKLENYKIKNLLFFKKNMSFYIMKNKQLAKTLSTFNSSIKILNL